MVKLDTINGAVNVLVPNYTRAWLNGVHIRARVRDVVYSPRQYSDAMNRRCNTENFRF